MASSSSISLELSTLDCLIDEKIHIKVTGVEGPVRLEATIVDEKGYFWVSWADFQPEGGVVSPSTQPPLCGTYSGTHPMGLFYSLFPAPGERFPNRLIPRQIDVPQSTRICVFPVPENCEAKKGTKSIVLEDDEIKINYSCCPKCTDFPQSKHLKQPLAEATVKRRYMGEGVQRFEIEEGGIFGSLFVPSKKWGKKTFPAVVDMFGSVGGLVEHRSALFASKGIVSLALPFFNYKSLPKTSKKLDLVYFEKAVRFLLAQPMVEKVGAIGVSQGGAYVLAMAAELPKGLLSGVISISPPSRFFDPLIYHGKVLLEPVDYDVGFSKILDLGDQKALLSEEMFYSQIEVDPVNLENSECPILFFTGMDDKNLPAKQLVDHIISYAQQARRNSGKPELNNFRHLFFEKAGHLIEPPYSPHCYCSWHGTVGVVMLWGGDVDGHADAQDIAWEETLNFIHTNMSKPPAKM